MQNQHDKTLNYYVNYYMYVIFLDENQITNFKKLIFYKNTPIILKIPIMNNSLLSDLYKKINYACDNYKNNKNILNILYSLEKYSINKDRNLLKSRDFYITDKQQNETIRIITKDNKTFIFLKGIKVIERILK